MKKILVCSLFVFFASCALNNPSADQGSPNPYDLSPPANPAHISNIEARYPFFNVKIAFAVIDQEVNPEYKNLIAPSLRARKDRILISEKSNILYTLDTIKFVVNTPEFKNSLRSRINLWPSDATGSAVYSTIKGQPFDAERVLEVISNASFRTVFVKQQLPSGVAGQGSVLADIRNKLYYISNDTEMMNFRHTLALPNRDDWVKGLTIYTTEGSYAKCWQPSYTDGYTFAETIFHEAVHNMGFVGLYHTGESSTTDNDVVYGIGKIVSELMKDPAFVKKYKAEMDAFRPYYPALYRDYLMADTTPANSALSVSGYEGKSGRSASPKVIILE